MWRSRIQNNMKAGTETVDFKSRPRYDIAVKTVRIFTIRAMVAMIDDMCSILGWHHLTARRRTPNSLVGRV